MCHMAVVTAREAGSGGCGGGGRVGTDRDACSWPGYVAAAAPAKKAAGPGTQARVAAEHCG